MSELVGAKVAVDVLLPPVVMPPVLTFNRPATLNALTFENYRTLRDFVIPLAQLNLIRLMPHVAYMTVYDNSAEAGTDGR